MLIISLLLQEEVILQPETSIAIVPIDHSLLSVKIAMDFTRKYDEQFIE